MNNKLMDKRQALILQIQHELSELHRLEKKAIEEQTKIIHEKIEKLRDPLVEEYQRLQGMRPE